MDTNHGITIVPARSDDSALICHFLEKAELPTTDLVENIPHFFKAKIELSNNEELAGTVGLEFYKPFALLRSLATASYLRNNKIGEKLVNKALDYAKNNNVQKVYLLTTTSEKYFEKLGFDKIERNEVPYEITQSRQFAETCPSTATIMYKSI